MAEEAPLCTLPSTDREYAFLLIAIKNVNLTYYIINITMNTNGWEEAKAQKIDVIILHLNILKIIPTTVEHRQIVQTSTGTGMSFWFGFVFTLRFAQRLKIFLQIATCWANQTLQLVTFYKKLLFSVFCVNYFAESLSYLNFVVAKWFASQSTTHLFLYLFRS